MGQVEDMFEMSNQEAANILRNTVLGYGLKISRGNGKSLTALRCIQAIQKAIDILEKTPDEKTKKTINFIKLCHDCDGKDFHPVAQLNGESRNEYKHKCPKCRKIWYECDDE